MLKFISTLPGLKAEMPIVTSKEVNFRWVEKMIEYHKKNKPPAQTSKCPGIRSLIVCGWIQRSYQDFSIETFGDEKRFLWSTPIDQKTTFLGEYLSDYVSHHGSNQLADYFARWKKDTLKTIIKIQSPWLVEIPKGYSLLMTSVPYNDDNRFTAATGILKGTNFLNVQLYWHCLNSKETVRKGTPLNQMILLKDDIETDYDIDECLTINEFEKRFTFLEKPTVAQGEQGAL